MWYNGHTSGGLIPVDNRTRFPAPPAAVKPCSEGRGSMRVSNQLESILMEVQKPARYTGGEVNSVIKDPSKADIRFAFCFPDTYEVGMSHLGMKILYSVLNRMEGVWCERVFAPWLDMQEAMAKQSIPLYALESKDPLLDFDFIGFTLQYELSYTNVLAMLDLAGLPLRAADRGEDAPVVIAGGPCACNPEPLADFIDLFSLGEGEEALPELMELYRACQKEGAGKREFLRRAAQIPGFYVPALYDVVYQADGTIASVTARAGAPAPVEKRIIRDLDSVYYPEAFVVPYLDIVHDRAVEEIFRGCIRGCRFCQAGYIYRPVREKDPETACGQARALCEATGYDELSLSSLSTSDYTRLDGLLEGLLSWSEPEHVSLSLPSLRIDNFSSVLLEKVSRLKKSGLTFAPEAGTQRLRDVINKRLTEEDILNTCRTAFEGGYTSVKLYFMVGLPTETDEDVVGIARLAQTIVDLYYSLPAKPKGKSVQVSISVASFVPKPFTPFQWFPQNTREELRRKQRLLLDAVTTRKVSVSWHDADVSELEAVFARGDRRLGRVIEAAYRRGCKFDSWDDCLDLEKWRAAFRENGLSMDFYAHRPRNYNEVLPWDLFDYKISRAFLQRENEKALAGETTPHCRESCAGCGAAVWKEGVCVENRQSGVSKKRGREVYFPSGR